QALVQRLDDSRLPLAERWVVDARVAGDHAEGLRVLDGAERLGGVEPGLGWDTAAVEAGAADFVALDEGGGETELCGPDGSRVAASPRPYYYEIELVQLPAFVLWDRAIRHSDCRNASRLLVLSR